MFSWRRFLDWMKLRTDSSWKHSKRNRNTSKNHSIKCKQRNVLKKTSKINSRVCNELPIKENKKEQGYFIKDKKNQSEIVEGKGTEINKDAVTIVGEPREETKENDAKELIKEIDQRKMEGATDNVPSLFEGCSTTENSGKEDNSINDHGIQDRESANSIIEDEILLNSFNEENIIRAGEDKTERIEEKSDNNITDVQLDEIIDQPEEPIEKAPLVETLLEESDEQAFDDRDVDFIDLEKTLNNDLLSIENFKTESKGINFSDKHRDEGIYQRQYRSTAEKFFKGKEKLQVFPPKEEDIKRIRIIDDTSEIAVLKNRINKEIQNVTLLCEIEISDREYAKLLVDLRKTYSLLLRSDIVSVISPSFAVALVQIAIRNYKGSGYWKLVAEALGIKHELDLSERDLIGDTLYRTLRTYGKPFYKPTENVTNVMIHSFITNKYLLKFFDYLYQCFSLDFERTVSTDAWQESSFICDAIMDPDSKRQQFLSKYSALSIYGNYEYCRQIIAEMLLAMHDDFWDVRSSVDLKGRFGRAYLVWRSKTKLFIREKQERKRNGGQERKYHSPHMICDLEISTFKMVLPTQMIHDNENMDAIRIRWKINGSKEIPVPLIEGVSGYKTKEIEFDISERELFSAYNIELLYNEEILRTFSIKESAVRFFDEKGFLIPGENLSSGMVYAYTKIQTDIKSSGLLNRRVRRGLKFYELEVNNGSLIHIEDEQLPENYYVAPEILTGLTQEYVLEGVRARAGDRALQVFSQIPSLIVEAEDDQYTGIAVVVNDNINRLFSQDFVNITVGRDLTKKYYYVDTSKLKGIREGFNIIIVDYPGRRQISYGMLLLEGFHYQFEDAPYVFKSRATLLTKYRVCKNCFEYGKSAENGLDFSLEDVKNGWIELPVVNLQKDLYICFEVPILEYTWDGETWKHDPADDIWHTELKDIIYIRYPGKEISLSIKTNTRNERFPFVKNSEGNFVCDLTRLKAYLDKTRVLNIISLIIQGTPYDFLRIVTRSILSSAVLQADYNTDTIIGTFDIIGKGVYFADVLCGGETLIEKEAITDGKISFSSEIRSADYVVKVYEGEDEFGFGEFTYLGSQTVSLINPLDLVGSTLKIINIYDVFQDIHLPVIYDCYVFLKNKNEDFSYTGKMIKVFHNTQILEIDDVEVRIPDLNNINSVTIQCLDEDETFGFLYDNYASDITRDENPRLKRSEAYRRYNPVLDEDRFLFNVTSVPMCKELIKKAEQWKDTRNSSKESFWSERTLKKVGENKFIQARK